jgi:D-mannonate dehydratase
MLALAFMNAIAATATLSLACHPESPSQAIQGIHKVVDTA